MKTVPTVRLADASDTAGLPELPEEIQLAMTDIAGVAREGLLAMSVAAGLAVLLSWAFLAATHVGDRYQVNFVSGVNTALAMRLKDLLAV